MKCEVFSTLSIRLFLPGFVGEAKMNRSAAQQWHIFPTHKKLGMYCAEAVKYISNTEGWSLMDFGWVGSVLRELSRKGAVQHMFVILTNCATWLLVYI